MKKQSVNSLKSKNWGLCRENVVLRDGYVCIIPGCGKREALQLDHAISRQCKATFYETDILQFLCPEHHTHKSFRKGQWVDLTVRDICVARIGQERWDALKFMSRKNCGDFGKLWYQEQWNLKLKEQRAELLSGGM